MTRTLATFTLGWLIAAATPVVTLNPLTTDWASLAPWAIGTLAMAGAITLIEIAEATTDAIREWRRTRRPAR